MAQHFFLAAPSHNGNGSKRHSHWVVVAGVFTSNPSWVHNPNLSTVTVSTLSPGRLLELWPMVPLGVVLIQILVDRPYNPGNGSSNIFTHYSPVTTATVQVINVPEPGSLAFMATVWWIDGSNKTEIPEAISRVI